MKTTNAKSETREIFGFECLGMFLTGNIQLLPCILQEKFAWKHASLKKWRPHGERESRLKTTIVARVRRLGKKKIQNGLPFTCSTQLKNSHSGIKYKVVF